MSLIACALLALLLLGYVFILPPEIEEGMEKGRLAFLRERKDVLYDNLRDLNFEYRAGKLSQADFESQRGALESEAAALLSEISALEIS
jgi:hypothetical protein